MKRQKSCLILFLFYGGYILDNQLVMTTLTLTSVFTLLRTHLCNEKGTYPSPGRSRSSSPRGTPSPSRVISTLSLPTSEKQITSRRPPIANFRWKTGKQFSQPPPPQPPPLRHKILTYMDLQLALYHPSFGGPKGCYIVTASLATFLFCLLGHTHSDSFFL